MLFSQDSISGEASKEIEYLITVEQIDIEKKVGVKVFINDKLYDTERELALYIIKCMRECK